MERDPTTGRFLPGNKIAVGNRGNHFPKWGNKNALKYGLYEQNFEVERYKSNCLLVFQGSQSVLLLPGCFRQDGEYTWLRLDVVSHLRAMGFVLKEK